MGGGAGRCRQAYNQTKKAFLNKLPSSADQNTLYLFAFLIKL